MSSSRRSFVLHSGLSAAGLLALPSTGTAAPAPLPAGDGRAPFADQLAHAEREAWQGAALAGPPGGGEEAGAPAPGWDTSWTRRLTGTHKAMFDIPEVQEGSGVARAVAWLQHYQEVLTLPRAAISQVVVIRAMAIGLVMNHAFWETYAVGKALQVRTPEGKEWAVRNPVLADGAGGAANPYTLDALLAGGSIVLGCGTAFRGVVGLVAQRDALAADAAEAKAKAMLVPGVILQPSGIFAGTLAQHHGCCFVRAV